MTISFALLAQALGPDMLSAISGGFTYTLLGWLTLFVLLLFAWAITTTKLTMYARRTRGRSGIIRWVSAAVGIVVFVLVPAFAARLLLPSALLLGIAPVVLLTGMATRTGTGLAKSTAVGSGRTAILAYRIFLRLCAAILELSWTALSALLNFDWAKLKALPTLARETINRIPFLGLESEVREVVLLEGSGTPLDPATDARLKSFPKSVPERLASLLKQSLGLRASEAFLTSGAGGNAAVRFKIDGMMVDGPAIGADEVELVSRVAKILAGLSTSKNTPSQDGSFPIMCGDKRSDVFVATAPSAERETVVLRIAADERLLFESGLAGLGMDEEALSTLRGLLANTEGLILVAGRPDSGHSTTIYSAISELVQSGRSVAAVEKSMRHRLDHVPQVKPEGNGAGYVKAIESALRNDPEVLVVRDIIDRETAELCMRTTLAGRLVIAGIIADDSVNALQRLLTIGVDPGLVRLSVTGVASQRLVRVLCDSCKKPFDPPPDLLAKLGIRATEPLQLYRETGCSKCRGTGFLGRTGIFELLVGDEGVKSVLTGDATTPEARRELRKSLTGSLKQSAVKRVRDGTTSVQEILRVLK